MASSQAPSEVFEFLNVSATDVFVVDFHRGTYNTEVRRGLCGTSSQLMGCCMERAAIVQFLAIVSLYHTLENRRQIDIEN